MFMQGRYGMDSLNGCILIVAGILWLVNLFVRPLVPSLVLWATESGLVALAVVRSLSRNINMRALENRRFQKIYHPVRDWVQLQRVRNQKGDHGVRCPKCRKEFRVKI